MDRQLTIEGPRAPEFLERDAFDPSRDVLAAIWRRPSLFLFAIVLALGLGALYFFKAPPTYQSNSELLVQSRRSPAFSNEAMRDRIEGKHMPTETHAQILISPVLIERTIERIGRKNLPSLRGITSPVDFMLENLTVEEKELESGVLDVRYRSKDAEDCYKVVSTLVECYHEFLEESSKDIGEETTTLIVKAKNELLTELQNKEQKYHSFRQSAPLLWEDGKGINPHQQRQLELENARAELEIERSQIVGKLNQITEILKRGDSESVYFEALSELTQSSDLRNDDQLMNREAIRTLTAELTQLRVEEMSLSDQFANEHPDLISIRSTISRLEEELRRLRAAMLPFANVDSDLQITETDYIRFYTISLKDQVDAIGQQLAEMDKVFADQQEKARELQAYIIQDESQRKDIERTQQLFDAVVARLDEINIVRDYGSDRVSMLEIPIIGKRVAPGLVRTFLGSCFLGTIFGVCLCVIVEKTEATFQDSAEISQLLQVPVIGRIPRMARRDFTQSPDYPNLAPALVSLHRQGSNLSEAFRAVRTSLFFSTHGESHKVIQVTSPLPGDGKSTLSANLAVTIANSGKRVLLLDADFRRPTLHKIFGCKANDQLGLSDVVTGNTEPIDNCLLTPIENLYLMTCGKQPDNPSELLSSPEFGNLLELLRERFDFVILDTPPLLAVTDPSAVAAWVDGTILALRLRRGVRIASMRAKEMLNGVNARILGVVVNNVEKKSSFAKRSYKYSYGQPYGYNSEQYSNRSVKKLAHQVSES